MISRRHSVFFKLHTFFALALIILTLLFFSALKEQEHQKYRRLVHRSMELSQTLESLKNHTCESQNRSLTIAGFKEIQALNRHAKEVTLPLQMKQTLQRTQLHVAIYQDEEGISYALIRDHCTMFYRDMSEKNTYYFVWLLFFTLFGGLVSMYLLLWRNLIPLKQLYEQITRYGEGKEIHPSPNTGKDEIALISNALFDALEKQRRLKSSRELFLRNIMHELKTPITKGKLIVELEEERPNILLLGKLFSRLDHLVHQMAHVEKMHAFALQRQEVNLNTLITTAMENLLLENDHVSLSGCNTTINVDPHLFTSALQNFLDNAVRHATTLPVLVTWSNKKICIQNSGEPLKRPVEEALQAFVTERGEGGLGLGLYIAQSVCELHNFQLTYRYEEGIHTFCIEL